MKKPPIGGFFLVLLPLSWKYQIIHVTKEPLTSKVVYSGHNIFSSQSTAINHIRFFLQHVFSNQLEEYSSVLDVNIATSKLHLFNHLFKTVISNNVRCKLIDRVYLFDLDSCSLGNFRITVSLTLDFEGQTMCVERN